jgi:hypothetical protein
MGMGGGPPPICGCRHQCLVRWVVVAGQCLLRQWGLQGEQAAAAAAGQVRDDEWFVTTVLYIGAS